MVIKKNILVLETGHLFRCVIIFVLSFSITTLSNEGKIKIVPQVGHTTEVTALSISPDGRYLASVNDQRILSFWPLKSNKLDNISKEHTCKITSIAFTYDMLASVGEDNMVSFWLLESDCEYSLSQSNKLESGSINISSLSYSSDGKMLAIASHNSVKLYATESKTLIIKPKYSYPEPKHEFVATDQIIGVKYSPDGKILVSYDTYGDVFFWPIENRDTIHLRHLNVTCATFSSDSIILKSTEFIHSLKLQVEPLPLFRHQFLAL